MKFYIYFIIIFFIIIFLVTYLHFLNKNFSYLNKYFQQIYVITLPERKKYIKNVMNNINLHCEYFPAILKKNIDKNQLVASGVLSYQNKFKNDGEIACYLSHISVLKKFLSSNAENCLIFEDDLKMPESPPTNISKIFSTIPSDYDIIYLGRCWDNCQKNVPVNNFIVKPHNPYCTHAYGVSRKGANKIIALSKPLEYPIDNILAKSIFTKKLIAYAISPSIFFQNREELGSSLNNINRLQECH